MEHLNLTASGPKLSRICLGTWAMGGWLWGNTDDQQSIETIHRAIDLGVNFIDTAPVYGFGRSEEVVGKALNRHPQRKNIYVATKAGLEWDSREKVFRNSDPKRIQNEVEDSLRRLGRDHIDLYQIHWPDPLVSIEDTAKVYRTLLDSGKIGAVGVSNFSSKQMRAFREICPIVTSQPPYNLFERGVESDALLFCEANNIITLAYGSLCRGLLSGRMRSDTKFDDGDLRNVDPKFQPERYSQYLAAVAALDLYAKDMFRKSVLELAVRWVIDQGKVIALWGGRRPEQMESIPEIMSFSLKQKHFDDIDNIVSQHVKDPIGPEFMESPDRSDPNYQGKYKVRTGP